MSLINEALKRAQRQRKADDAGYAPPVPGQTGGHTVAHRGKPMSSQTLILIVAGAAALIVLSVVATVYLLRDDAAPAPAAPTTLAQIPVAPAPAKETTPQVVLSIPTPAEKTAEAQPAETKPAPAPVPVQAAVPAKTPAAVATPVAPAPVVPTPTAPVAAKPAPVKPDPLPATPSPAAVTPAVTPDQQVLVFLDNLRIMGVRFSGLDSKVLIGDRVYRVNDVIERNFGLKLVEVQPDRLFFVDARGVTYAKNL